MGSRAVLEITHHTDCQSWRSMLKGWILFVLPKQEGSDVTGENYILNKSRQEGFLKGGMMSFISQYAFYNVI